MPKTACHSRPFVCFAWSDDCAIIACPCGFAQAPTNNHCEGVRGLEFVHIQFEVAQDLAYWRAEIPGKLKAFAEALSGPTTPAGTRVQLHNAPGSEVGPGQVMTWGEAVDNEVDGFGLKWSWGGHSSKHIPFDWTGPKFG
jgi:hypothetical protein